MFNFDNSYFLTIWTKIITEKCLPHGSVNCIEHSFTYIVDRKRHNFSFGSQDPKLADTKNYYNNSNYIKL